MKKQERKIGRKEKGLDLRNNKTIKCPNSKNINMIECEKIRKGATFLTGYAFKSEDFSLTGIPVIKIANIQDRVVRPEGSQKRTNLDYRPYNSIFSFPCR
jgi:hypothetical protein